MKRSIKAILLLAALAVLVGGYALVRSLAGENVDVRENEGAYPILGEETSIAALTWTRGETTISLRKSGDTWYVEGDEEYPLDQNAVEALVQSLASLTAHMRLEGVEAPEDYGLTEPALAAAVELANGETRALFMGDEALLGGEYYLGTGEEGVVYVTDVALSSILSASVAELTQWEEIPRLESVARLVILGPNASLDQSYFADSSALTYNPDWHWFQTGMQYPSDEDAMRLLLDDVDALAWNAFVAHGVANEDLAAYGLDSANATSVVAFEEGACESSLSVVIGAACEGGYYAMLAGSDCVYTVAAESVASLLQATDVSVRATDALRLDWEQVARVEFDASTPLTLVREESAGAAAEAESAQTQEAGTETGETVTLNGEAVDVAYAREAFEDITSLSGDGFVDGLEVLEPLLTITVYTDAVDFPQIALRFGAYDATSYVLENGVQPPMLVSAASVDALIRTWMYMPAPAEGEASS